MTTTVAVTELTNAAADAFERWEEGEISAREAIAAIVSAEYVAADAAFKQAEQRKKQVRGQLEQLVRAVGEPVVCAGFELAWREGTMGASYPAQRVDWAVRTLHELIAQLLGSPQLPPHEAATADAPNLEATYRIPHTLVEEVIATVEHLAAGREERVRAGALYVTTEEAKQRQEKRRGQSGEDGA